MVVYITAQGGKVIRDGGHLIFRQRGEEDRKLLLHQLEQLVVCGNITLTQPALALLLGAGIDTVLLRHDGRYLGRLTGQAPKNVDLRARQFRLSDDPEVILAVAKNLLAGKLANMAHLLRRIGRARQVSEVNRAAKQIMAFHTRLAGADTLPTLLGLEGGASAVYFKALRHGLLTTFGFQKRMRRPPPDPINLLLSLLYTFLANRVHAAIEIAGLDPQPGFLHAPRYGRNSLPLDLMEEFRPLVVDSLVLSLVNLKVMGEKDFFHEKETQPTLSAKEPDPYLVGVCEASDDDLGLGIGGERDNSSPEIPEGKESRPFLRLQPQSFRKIVAAFERKMQSEFTHPEVGSKMSYAEALSVQARVLREVIEEKRPHYQPLVLR